ncbi:DUF1549 and DUF1553 domain-containing protein [Gimesia panareensis]|uniref:DUF1549 and DUF1553 domain-containing protein n=1 Tax=Gimesia panareensis TaxID=2527978 RepID=UPI00118902F8|nr:DUF1549 and DUF1553 domain-containing protein [Gimesia panareensis]QDU50608.1 hypothetical protein Pan110_29600 [Gimesia panareensis]
MLSAYNKKHNRGLRADNFLLLAGLILMFSCATAFPAEEVATDSRSTRLGHQIDQLITQARQQQQVQAAPRSTDAEFMRRVYLDLTGKIPPVAEVRQFLADSAPDKRERLIDRLLASPGFVVHFTSLWRNILIPEAGTDPLARQQVPEFEAWLRSQLQQDTSYDALVRAIVGAPFDETTRTTGQTTAAEPTARAFYLVKQLKPESLAASTSRAFLGVRIECAQCHDHPFDTWKQDQFWQFAAFFANIDQPQPNSFLTPANLREVSGKPEIKIPDTNRLVEATYLNGKQPNWKETPSRPRQRLSEWITSAQNPYFAKATANRVWSLFFGRGIVDPVDDFSSTNPASHPELLEVMARAFQKHDYDLKYLIREITNSETYQLTSRQTDPSQSRVEWYGKMPTRGLTAEQIFANLVQATGFFRQTAETDPQLIAPGMNSPQAEIQDLFQTDSENQLDPRATILQALALMNGTFITNATSLEQSDVFTAIVEFPGQSSEQKIEAFYLSTLSRPPTESELNRLKTYINSSEEKTEAYANLFWALLNSSEFLLNH